MIQVGEKWPATAIATATSTPPVRLSASASKGIGFGKKQLETTVNRVTFIGLQAFFSSVFLLSVDDRLEVFFMKVTEFFLESALVESSLRL
jgi:hypothetical protein